MSKHLKCAIKVAFSPVVVLVTLLISIIEIPLVFFILVSGCLNINNYNPRFLVLLDWYSKL